LAQQQLEPFGISDNDLNQIAGDLSEVSFEAVWNEADPSEGAEIIATGPLGRVVVCPKPCSSFIIPEQF